MLWKILRLLLLGVACVLASFVAGADAITFLVLVLAFLVAEAVTMPESLRLLAALLCAAFVMLATVIADVGLVAWLGELQFEALLIGHITVMFLTVQLLARWFYTASTTEAHFMSLAVSLFRGLWYLLLHYGLSWM